ncbi:hypothetical protein ACFO0M_04375 [Micromonospora mangrovi]|uniref:Uncharacterized protein n=2 Tax=Micromonospora TaxID=1873 RepID=A0AAU7M3I5_9ACTN
MAVRVRAGRVGGPPRDGDLWMTDRPVDDRTIMPSLCYATDVVVTRRVPAMTLLVPE